MASNRFTALDDDTVPRESDANVIPSHVTGQIAGSNRVVPKQSSSVTEIVEFLGEDDSTHNGEESVAGDSLDPSPELEILAD